MIQIPLVMLCVAAALVAFLALVILVETLAALLAQWRWDMAATRILRGDALNAGSPRSGRAPGTHASVAPAASGSLRDRPGVAVLIPAHNEEDGIGETLAMLKPQLRDGDRMLVVADNCSDGTAEVARDRGAEVVERHDSEKRGKGYALAFGWEALASDPRDVVVVLDADCRAQAGSIDALAGAVGRHGRPQQAVYLMVRGKEETPGGVVSRFAFLVKNWVRPLGLCVMHSPCLAKGSGMAFPKHAVRVDELANGNIVEDMALGLVLGAREQGPMLCPDALVLSDAPSGLQGMRSQRKRWEHGHLHTLLVHALPMLWRGLISARLRLVALSLELAVPPLSLLVALLGLLTLAGGVVAWLVPQQPLAWTALGIAGGGLMMVAAAVGLAWLGFGRYLVPARLLLRVPAYIMWKLPLYVGFVFRRQRAWVRTER